MSSLSAARRAALQAVVQAAPDAVLAQLGVAAPSLGGGKAAEFALLVAEEVRDRVRRDTAFAPLLPMFRPRADGVPALVFPSAVLTRVWREARAGEEAFLGLLDGAGAVEGEWTKAADRLCARAAAVLRDRPGDVWPDDISGPASPGSKVTAIRATSAELAGCFDLVPLTRTALPRLPVWLERPDSNQAAGLRLLIQDCLEISPDGGRRMIDILFAHVADAERMLRVVTRTNRLADTEAILSHSEMGGFVERLLAAVQTRVRRIAAGLSPRNGADMAPVVEDAAWCAGVLAEMDMCLQLRPDSPWGKAARMARIEVAGQLSRLMKSTSAAVHAALPMKRQVLAGRMTRLCPWLEAPVKGELIEAAAVLLSSVARLRGAAVTFGCEADRQGLRAELIDYLSTWANEALDSIADGGVADPDPPLRLIGTAARFLTLIEALEAARAIRRRAAAAEAAQAMRPKVAEAAFATTGFTGASPAAA